MNFGSTLYGTSTPNSDVDIKGVFLPSLDQLFLNDIPKCIDMSPKKDNSRKNTKDDTDMDMYSLHYFIKLALQGETAAIDMLHANDENIIESSSIWKEIVKNREKFYTKDMKSFVGYCRRQADKYGIKGSRIQEIEAVLDTLVGYEEHVTLGFIWDKLPLSTYCYFTKNKKNDIPVYSVCGKKFQQTVKLKFVIAPLYKYLRNYGERAHLAKTNQGIDWKAISHALRAALQIREILLTNNLVYPLKDAKLLTTVKQGKLDFLTVVNPMLEDLIREVNELSEISTLPSKPDIKFWNRFIIETCNKRYIK